MKKITSTIIVLLLLGNNLFASKSIPEELLFNLLTGYQTGFSQNATPYLHAFDVNGYCFINPPVYWNIGYNYQNSIGHKAYLGLGVLNLIQFQLGYAFNTDEFLLRYRSDFPLFLIESFFIPIERLEGGGWRSKPGKLRNYSSAVGFFVESRFNNGYKGMAIGLTLGISIWDIRRAVKTK
jgi:hypothetical protein